MAVLVDTSVWIAFFRGENTPEVGQLKRLLGREELLMGDLILAELLQGLRTESDLSLVERHLAHFRVMSLVGEANARQSAANYRALRRQGITVRKTIDCLIATWCIQAGVSLLHADGDFTHFIQLGLVER
jgi:predicted nucleic acid-binding protein